MNALFAQMDPALQMLLLMGSLSLIPFLVIGMTSFLRYIIVLSFLKTAMGTQQVPPAMVLVGMALILTFYTMSPVFGEMYERIDPATHKNTTVLQMMAAGSEPLKEFMMRQTRQSDVAFFVEMARHKMPKTPQELNIWEVAPAFSRLRIHLGRGTGFDAARVDPLHALCALSGIS